MTNTKIIKIDEENIDLSALAYAGEVIKKGGLVAFPTETVYGLGGDALSASSSEKIYNAKGRPSDNPLIIHICRIADLEKIAVDIPEAAYLLAEVVWPGPLTMVLKKAEAVPLATTGGLQTVAVRMPQHKTALAFIQAAGGFVAAPSANKSGRPSPTVAKYVVEDLSGKIDVIIDGGEVGIGLESTIVDLTGEVPIILRPGYISKRMIGEFLGYDAIGQEPTKDDTQAPKAPGMKYRHYAPKGKLTIIKGDKESVLLEINKRTKELQKKAEKVGVIATDETQLCYLADSVKSTGGTGDGDSVAKHLYRILREFDDEGVTVIFSQDFGQGEIGIAVMNRLCKAAEYRIETV